LSRHELALRVIQLLNNNKYVFGPNRRPIVQFSVENRRALQLQEQRRERVHAKQELLKNPTNKILSFENNKKKNQRKSNLLDQTNNKIRLSEIIKQQQQQEIQEELNDFQDDNKNFMKKINSKNNSNIETTQKRKRPKTKSKSEIRDKFDRMIDHSRNKPQLPTRTKEKWFE